MSVRLLTLCIVGLLLLGAARAGTAEESSPEATEGAAATPSSADEYTRDEREESPAPAGLRLDEITIEGEVDVPRVLFIESRDRLRRTGFLHHLFLPDVAELGRGAPLGHGLSWTPQGEIPTWTP